MKNPILYILPIYEHLGDVMLIQAYQDEAKEGRDAFLEKRPPNFNKKWIP